MMRLGLDLADYFSLVDCTALYEYCMLILKKWKSTYFKFIYKCFLFICF